MESANNSVNLSTTRLNDINEIMNLIESPRLFQSKEWIMSIKKGLNHNPFALLTSYKNRKIQLNIFWKRNYFYFIKIAGSPIPGSFTPYIDPIYFEDIEDTLKQKILNHQYIYLKSQGFNFINQSMSQKCNYEKSLCLNFLRYDYKSTYLIKIISDREKMWNYISSRARNSIRKSIKSNVVVSKMDTNNKEIKYFYAMLKDTFLKRKALPFHSLKLFLSIAKNLSKNKLLILQAKVADEIISIGWFIFDHEEIHYLSGASTPKGNKLNANNLIQWEIIKYAIKNKISFYDMGGKGDIAAINKFKESLNPNTVEYFQVSYKSLIFKISESLFFFLRYLKTRTSHLIKTSK